MSNVSEFLALGNYVTKSEAMAGITSLVLRPPGKQNVKCGIWNYGWIRMTRQSAICRQEDYSIVKPRSMQSTLLIEDVQEQCLITRFELSYTAPKLVCFLL